MKLYLEKAIFNDETLSKTTPDTLKSVAEAPNDENKCGLSSNVVIADKKLSTDKSIHDTASNQNKADYKVVAENAIWARK